MFNIDISKYSPKLHLTYNKPWYFDNTINNLPIKLQEDLIRECPKYINSIRHQTFNMWQTVLSIDLKYMRHFNKDKCQRYNCCKEVWELFHFLTI